MTGPQNTPEEASTQLDGFPMAVTVTAGRENVKRDVLDHADKRKALEMARTHHVIWEDGTRTQMCCELVNCGEIRGWWARKGETYAFTAPLAAFKMPPVDISVMPEGGKLRGFISWKLKCGQRCWCTTYAVHVQSTWHNITKDYVFCGIDDTMTVTLVKRVRDYDGECTETLSQMPINKFLDNFRPKRTVKDAEKMRQVRMPFALTLATLWKIKTQFRKVHLRCEEKKYAPGGTGHKRARSDFESLRREDGHMLDESLRMRGIDLGKELQRK